MTFWSRICSKQALFVGLSSSQIYVVLRDVVVREGVERESWFVFGQEFVCVGRKEFGNF